MTKCGTSVAISATVLRPAHNLPRPAGEMGSYPVGAMQRLDRA